MPNRLPDQTSHKAVAAAIGAWVVYGLARATGLFEAPPVDELRDLTLVALEGLVPAIVAGGFAWITPNRPKGGDVDAGAPEGGRLLSPDVAALGAIALLAIVLSGCASLSDRIDGATGSTLAERCANYRLAVDTLETIQGADGTLTADQQLRLTVYRNVISQVCLPAEMGEALPEG